MVFCDVVKDYIHGRMLSMQLLMAAVPYLESETVQHAVVGFWAIC